MRNDELVKKYLPKNRRTLHIGNIDIVYPVEGNKSKDMILTAGETRRSVDIHDFGGKWMLTPGTGRRPGRKKVLFAAGRRSCRKKATKVMIVSFFLSRVFSVLL